ncbi:MAG: hypothetical protein J7604_03620 [Sporocytophaga sp.]|uniref:hypothetical protein n=1 Tax=Sporocytophaga sp. TaxID=2231183 RepID=UPI001B1BD305|nr:hypothetical protein [Sporocytophaga sp.]MBO9699270.1 hypothetical protein [Sporocytophaga sp.]
MKHRVILTASILFFLCLTLFTGCKKENVNESNDEVNEEVSDELAFEIESNLSLIDVEKLIEYTAASNLRTEGDSTVGESLIGICDLLKMKQSNARIGEDETPGYTINFSGITCDSRRQREGSMIINYPSGSKFNLPGGAIQITYVNYKITLLNTNKSFTINGTKKITNLTGGLVKNLQPTSPPIRHMVAGNITITYNDETQRTVNLSKIRTLNSLNAGNWQVALTGNGSYNGNDSISEYGVNTKGQNYYVKILSPIVLNTCGSFCKPISGVKFHKAISSGVTTLYGLDKDGNVKNDCSSRAYKMTWVNKDGIAKELIKKY